MAYQFIHIEVYSRQASKQNKKWSIRDIVAEANREPGATYHVPNPQKTGSGLVYGMPILEMEKLANDWGDQAKDARGHKLRKDGHCMLAGVISLPKEREKEWADFKARSLKYLQKKYGERLRTVVEHLDETHPHIHFYAVPNPGEKFDVLHEGQRAANALKNEKKGVQNQAYIKAMRGLQDEFADKVATYHGLLRLGPKRQRLTRGEYKRQIQQGQALAKVRRMAGQYIKQGVKKGLKAWDAAPMLDKFKLFWHAPSAAVVKRKAEVENQLNLEKERTKAAVELAKKAEEKATHYLTLGKAKHRELEAAEAENRENLAKAQKLAQEVADLRHPKPQEAPQAKKSHRLGDKVGFQP